MKIKELISKLNEFDQDLIVDVSHDDEEGGYLFVWKDSGQYVVLTEFDGENYAEV